MLVCVSTQQSQQSNKATIRTELKATDFQGDTGNGNPHHSSQERPMLLVTHPFNVFTAKSCHKTSNSH